ncbi:MAG: GAF domain-containing protein [Burkholderiales bacterium]|nr:GAF domain-containing protein [Burkholderiales bacterium]
MTPRWRLFPKYALLIVALVGGFLVVSGAIGIYSSWRENERNLIALQEEKAQAAAARIEQYILDIEQQLGWTALPMIDPGADPLEPRRIEYLKLLRLVPAITEVAWLDPGGHEQLRISRLAMDVIRGNADLSQEPRFKLGQGGATYYGPVYFRKDTEPYMTIARPAGSGGGVTAIEVNLKFVWDVVSRIRIGEKGLAYVVDAGGVLVAHPDISLVLKKTELKALPQVAALTGAAAAPARSIGGEPVLSAHAAIPPLRWTVFVESPEAEAFAPLRASILRAVLLLGAGLLVSMVASFFVARALVRPLRELQEGAARIGAGELDRRIEVRTGDELESLAEQFNQMGAALKESYRGLEGKVAARTAELSEALEQQIATSEVLQAISNSVADTAPVFDKILAACERLFAGDQLIVFLVDEQERLALGAIRGPEPERVRRLFPVPLAGTATEVAIRERRLVTFADVLGDPDVPQGLRRIALQYGASYSVAVAPLLWEGKAIGSILVGRPELRAFDDKEQRLLRTFAEQAVIAIQNARLFNETKEALERQTATAEILKVIAASLDDVQPVFDAIAASSNRLLGGHSTAVWRFREQAMHLVGFTPTTAEGDAALLQLSGTAVDRFQFGSRLVDGETVMVTDTEDTGQSVPEAREVARARGFRSMVITPLRRDNASIGMLSVTRREPGQFTPHQIELLQTFADQAVIAIENVRLFNETKDALQRQTATAEVLQVISGSVADAAPVFEKILDSCDHLFASNEQGILLIGDDGHVNLAAHRGHVRKRLEGMFPSAQTGDFRELLRIRGALHFKDVLADPGVPGGIRAVAEELGIGTYSQVFAPMLWKGQTIGTLYVARQPPTGFSEKEIELLRTFADQAVIAIQNARLFNETREALEQQTATAEVLQVISSSVADTQPVFEKILDSCQRLFAATGLGIYLIDDAGMLQRGGFRTRDTDSIPIVRSVADEFPRPLRGSTTELAIRERRVVHFADVLADADVPAPLMRVAASNGNFSIAFAPMLWEGRGVGAIQVSRQPPLAFSDKELTLLKTFADQAVIAIQNARLFNELEAKTQELERANKHKSEFLANMSHELRTPLNAIIGFSEVLSEQMFGEVNPKQAEYLLDIHTSGHHLLSLINDILDLSKIEAGRMELDLASTNLPMLLDNCTTLVRERASRQGLVLALEVEPDVGDWVADVRKLKQVVINLLSNAVKFTPAGGRVTLRARRLERAVEIAVVDTGVGIAADQQALVFEEFRQAGGDYLRKSEGTGLGLSLARRFVELHGGTIRVESEPGRGSTFAFILPERVVAAV